MTLDIFVDDQLHEWSDSYSKMKYRLP